MGESSEFPRDPDVQPVTDHCCDESERCGPGSFHPAPIVTASVPRIQDSALHATEGSRSSNRSQDHSVLYGPPRRRDPALDVFHSPPTHRGATHVRRDDHEPGPPVENLDPIHTLRFAQWDPSRDFVGLGLYWNYETYDRPETEGLRPNDGVSPPPANIDLSTPLQEVHTFNAFTPYLSFPRNDAQPYYSPHCAAVSGFGQTHPNQTQLSSVPQGPPLIPTEEYYSIAQPLTSQLDNCSSFSSRRWMTIVPQRPYGRKKRNDKQGSIIFKVNGRLGITAQEAINQNYVGLEGRDNQVFVDKSSVFMLRLEWPEYLPWSRKIRLNDWKKKPERIKLGKLATEVVKCIARFIKGAQTVQRQPDRASSDWRVGPELVGIDHLVLVSLDRVSKGSWQPRIGLLSHDEINSSSTPFVI